MKERIRHLYLIGKLTDAGLDAAVARGWILPDEHDAIVAERASEFTGVFASPIPS